MKPNLLFLPGALGVSSTFSDLKKLIEADYNVYCFDYPGHGFVPAVDVYTIPVLAEKVLSFIKANQLKNLHVFGYSMGGYIALYLESFHPGLFMSITTLGTKLDWNAETVNKEVKFLNPEKTKEKVPAFATYLAKLHGDLNWEKLMIQTSAMMSHLSENALTEKQFRSIQCPVKLLLGDKDTMVSKKETNRVHEWIIASKFNVLADTEHALEKVDVIKLQKFLVE